MDKIGKPEIPPETGGIPPEQEHERAKAYNRTKRYLFVVELLLGFLFLGAVFFWGISAFVARWAESIVTNPWLIVLIYIAIIGFIFSLISLPLDWYSGFVLEHKYEQSTQTFAQWAKDQLKGLLVNAAIGIALVEVVYFLLRRYPLTWWIIGGALFIVFAVILTILAPVLLLPIFFKVVPLRDEELKKRIFALCEKVHTRIKGIYEMDMSRKTRAANAALVGIGRTRRIILADTLLERYSPDEIEVVLAHELGHHKHWDIWRGLFFQSIIFFIAFFLAFLVLRAFAFTFELRSPADIAGFPLLVFTIAIVSFFSLPLINGFSRRIEWNADDFALRITGNPTAFVSMMAKLGRQNLAEFQPNRFVEIFLYSHPPIGKRIEHAREVFPDSREIK